MSYLPSVFQKGFVRYFLATTTQFVPFLITSENPKINMLWFYHYRCSLQWLLHLPSLNRYHSYRNPYHPHERDFFPRTAPLWKFQLSFIHFFKWFCLGEPPTPCGESMDIIFLKLHIYRKKRFTIQQYMYFKVQYDGKCNMFYITICSILDVILKFLMNEELLVNLSLGTSDRRDI